jgi:hypothetical protein
MKPNDLLLRCYAEKSEGHWQAFCLDLCLAAQGDSYKEVRNKLDAMISEYVYDALVGEDKAYAEQLLSRKAPFYQWAKYYGYFALIKLMHIKRGLPKLFKEPLPLVPQKNCHAHA